MERMSRIREQITAEAADWFVRLNEGKASAATREAFTQWTLRSPQHIEEFLAITRTWGDVSRANADDLGKESLIRAAREEPDAVNVIQLASGARQDVHAAPPPYAEARASARPRASYAWRAAAAAMVLVVVGLVWMGAALVLGPPSFRTAVGEQRTITLEDGSTVYLNTNSEVAVAFAENERRIILERGEARFDVAKNPTRPFVVSTSRATVRALGTVFNVQVAPASTAVAVLEGRVEVVSRDAPTEASGPSGNAESGSNDGETASHSPVHHPVRIQLAAGEQAAVTPEGEILANAGPPLERIRAWTERRLIFREERLSDVVAEFNRYHKQQLRIADPSLADHRISGTFAIQDVASLLQFLERYEHVEIEETRDGRMLRRRAETEHPAI